MKKGCKTAITVGLAYLALTTSCQQIESTRYSNGRLTESAIQAIEADRITEQRIYGDTDMRRPITFLLYGIQF